MVAVVALSNLDMATCTWRTSAAVEAPLVMGEPELYGKTLLKIGVPGHGRIRRIYPHVRVHAAKQALA